MATRRLILWIGAGLAASLVVLVVALLAVVALIDPNRFKPRIVHAVQAQTGRQLTLRGDLQWRVFPWLVVNAGEGALANSASFGSDEFARWQALRIGVKVLPLLHGQVIMDSIRAEGLVVNLQRNARGEANWQFTTVQVSPAGPREVQIDALQLRHATLRYADMRSGLMVELTDLSFDARLPAGTTLRKLRIDDLQLAARVFTAALGDAPVAAAFAAPSVSFDAASASLSVPAWTAAFGPAKFSGELAGSFATTATLQAELQMQTESLRGLLAAAGVAVPVTRDAASLGRFELAGAIRYAGDAAQATALRLRLDDTQMQGNAAVASGIVSFELAGDRIDLDRYLEPAELQGKPLELPLAQLKALQLSGELRLQEARMAGAVLKDVTLKLASATAAQ